MIIPKYSTKFRRDMKLMDKRGLDLNELKNIMKNLENENPLPLNQQDHPLNGEYIGFRECHIAPDWLLIYRIDKSSETIYFTRTGTHADLF